MKKVIIVPYFSLLFLISTTLSYAESDYYQPAKESKEEIVMNMFFSLLLPNIQETVSKYYSDYLTERPLVYPYQIKIINMERTGTDFMYSVTLEVTPVLGAHNPVGRDQLTFSITPNEIKLKNFKHMETFELPPHLQDIIKKK
ncbi:MULTISPECIES: DUF3888 domain-containing protein [unclassified Lysinibacillus]|uniref:DUF3888 domain-containing protein n=1 Tax=unclassified Lysinibacillus TaxID=2636778 RepID=UPI0025546E6E|nr:MULTISPECIES: DUF3888 domain-containing protein [unclassified Lysinibacillus]MDM5246573.1 DUF3888 domain-containing protein [Lysinibacillus sp. G4S2]